MRYSAIPFGASPAWLKAFLVAILALAMGFVAGTAEAEESGAPVAKYDAKFAIDLGDYSGSLVEVDASAAYQLSKHFGIGAGLKYFNLKAQAQKSGSGAEFDYSFFGPAVFGYASF